jgi:hypothetical protein
MVAERNSKIECDESVVYVVTDDATDDGFSSIHIHSIFLS